MLHGKNTVVSTYFNNRKEMSHKIFEIVCSDREELHKGQ